MTRTEAEHTTPDVKSGANPTEPDMEQVWVKDMGPAMRAYEVDFGMSGKYSHPSISCAAGAFVFHYRRLPYPRPRSPLHLTIWCRASRERRAGPPVPGTSCGPYCFQVVGRRTCDSFSICGFAGRSHIGDGRSHAIRRPRRYVSTPGSLRTVGRWY